MEPAMPRVVAAYELLISKIVQDDSAAVRSLLNGTDPKGEPLRNATIDLTPKDPQFYFEPFESGYVDGFAHRQIRDCMLMACLRGSVESARVLLDWLRDDPIHAVMKDNAYNPHGWSWCGCQLGKRELLLELPHPHDDGDTLGFLDAQKFADEPQASALMIAAGCGHGDLVALLVARGADVFFDANGETAANRAIANGHADVAASLRRAAGIDYWQCKHHGGHLLAMKEVVCTLLLVDQRLGAVETEPLLNSNASAVLPCFPKEIWLLACSFLRGADFLL